jgi:hypothetical protein
VNFLISTLHFHYPNLDPRCWGSLSPLIPMLPPPRWIGLTQKKWIFHFH